MNPTQTKEKIIEVLRKIQEDSGYSSAGVTGNAKPTEDLEGFDSKIWPVATTLISQALGITIPKNKNIFQDEHKKTLSIGQIADHLAMLAAATALT